MRGKFHIDPTDWFQLERGIKTQSTGVFAHEYIGFFDDENTRRRSVVEFETLGIVRKILTRRFGVIQRFVMPTNAFRIDRRRDLTEMIDESIGFVNDGDIS